PKEDFIKLTAFLKENKETENYNVKIFTTISSLKISPEGKIKLESILTRIKSLIPENGKSLEDFISQAATLCGFAPEDLEKTDKEALINISRFREFAKKYAEIHIGKLNDFIDYLEVLNVLSITIESPRIEDKGVRLMTSHATKGLEYTTVILTNMAQKRFPIERISKNKLLPEELISKPGIENPEEYERLNQMFEERRLCYVSFTRSKSELILTYAQEYAGKKFAPSQFLEEINYKENQDISFSQDLEEKAIEAEPNITITSSLEVLPEIKEKTLSPSALTLFENCQKKFEYKYVYNMPEKTVVSWDALKMGSFIHLVLEHGVKSNFKKLEDFINFAKDLKSKEEWESIDLEEVLPLIRIFYDRNKNKYSESSLTEKKLFTEFSGLKFMGIADRIDFLPNGIEIIDYKTGKTTPSGKERNWQLGYYALASKPIGQVKKLTLDVFQNSHPLEFAVKDNGDVLNIQSNRLAFNLHEVEAELIDLGNKIKQAYKEGFKPCPPEKNCEFCNEYVY
ncbi:MAG: PD-(D/E)XK nuclease family protein, partial [Nanoarchaeota archaeon]|nr:PD-(D/E)XK nuclease family protein [Nanoarchaeota archaeon]